MEPEDEHDDADRFGSNGRPHGPRSALTHSLQRHALATRIGAAFKTVRSHDNQVEAGILARHFSYLEAGIGKKLGPLLSCVVSRLDAHHWAARHDVRERARLLRRRAPVEHGDQRLRDVAHD